MEFKTHCLRIYIDTNRFTRNAASSCRGPGLFYLSTRDPSDKMNKLKHFLE